MNTKKSPIQIEVFDSSIGGTSKRCLDARELHTKIQRVTL